MSVELISEQERQSTYNVTPRHVRLSIVAVEKQAVLHILGVCVCVCVCVCVSVASDPQREIPVHHIVICSFSGSATFFHVKNQKLHDFRKKITKYKMCFDFLYNIFLKYLSF
jgi:hypothetical protein